MLKMVRKRVAKIPDLSTIDDRTMNKVFKIGEGAILRNIRDSKQADGAPIKRNSTAWLKFKAMHGWVLKPLVAEKKRFAKGNQKSFAVTMKKKGVFRRYNAVIIRPATDEVKRLSRWLQIKGYVGWFGLDLRAMETMRHLIRLWIKQQFDRAASK